jgi:hypothetical protein
MCVDPVTRRCRYWRAPISHKPVHQFNRYRSAEYRNPRCRVRFGSTFRNPQGCGVLFPVTHEDMRVIRCMVLVANVHKKDGRKWRLNE